MPLVLNENAANVNVLITIVDDNNNGIPALVFGDADLTISYMKDSDTVWTELTLVAGVLGAWTSSGFIAVPGSTGEYLLSLPAGAINARKTTMLKVEYSTNRPLRDIISFTGPPAFPTNFAALSISPSGKVITDSASLRFNMTIPVNPISLNGDISVFIGETGRTVTLIANDDISAIPLRITFEFVNKTDIVIVEDGALTKVAETVSLTLPAAVTAQVGLVRWSARHAVDNTVYGHDEFSVSYAPLVDPKILTVPATTLSLTTFAPTVT